MIDTHFLQLLYHIITKNHNDINVLTILQDRLSIFIFQQENVLSKNNKRTSSFMHHFFV